MIADARSVPAGAALETDVCVIGAGAAGITLALQLAAQSVRVVLLESGGDELEAETQALYRGSSSGLPYFPLDAARLRYLGGSTNHWGGVCRPFDEVDFEAQSWIPGSGWPISLADVAPYYGKAREICRAQSDDWDAAAWASRDRYDPLQVDAATIITRIAQIVPKKKRSFAAGYRDRLDAATGVAAYLHANVTEIEVDDAGASVTRVAVATLEGSSFTVSARTFVLAAGGIENPRLLLASNSRLTRGVGNQNDLVGRYFLEHPRFDAGTIIPFDAHLSSLFFYFDHDAPGSRIQPYLALSRERQRSEGIDEVQLRLEPVYGGSFERALASADVETARHLAGDLRGLDAGDLGRDLKAIASDMMTWQSFVLAGSPLPVPHPDVVGKVTHSSGEELEELLPDFLGDIAAAVYETAAGTVPLDAVRVVARINPVPNPDSRVTLSNERDELGMPRANLHWQLSRLDMFSVRRTLEIVAAEIGRLGVGRMRLAVESEEAPWPADLAGGWHLIGTTRMSDDPKQGVVDRDLRVHGMSNLYVTGSSVFPTSGSGTPTMTLVALTLRLGEHLLREQA